MANVQLIMKWYVKGLRIASVTLFGLYLLGMVNITLVPGIQSLFVKQILTFLMLSGILTFGAISVFVNEKNYSLCLVFAVTMQIAFPLVFGAVINYELTTVNAIDLLGGRMMDFAFVAAAGPMVVSIMFARFYLSIFLFLTTVSTVIESTCFISSILNLGFNSELSQSFLLS